ncbi:VanZ family protein [Salinimicrobium sp. TH3]|uniref:VanZ family protein n=1 Tax=Salinimicrobium sp. TH3 TaxID=2997342 RepID=UPI002273AB1E|nr:VanZ family protein [Salinimicrobium sp. TH3]MCY2685800.1 VanZ family protein [Salinimicrobium sp. TH3]
MKVKLLFLLTSVSYTILILYLSLINLSDTPVKDLGVSDKVMHGGAYFGLGLLWMLFVLFSFKESHLFKKIIIISLCSIAFGIFIEVLQDTLTSYRQLDLYDIFANTLGVVLAGILVWALRKYLIRLKAKINLDLMKN